MRVRCWEPQQGRLFALQPLVGHCAGIFSGVFGDELYSERMASSGAKGKPGCIHFEEPLLAPKGA